jgi:hypothetical protein
VIIKLSIITLLIFNSINCFSASITASYQNTAREAFLDQNGKLIPLLDDFAKNCPQLQINGIDNGIDARITEIIEAISIGYSKSSKRKYNLFINASAYRTNTLSSLDLTSLGLSFEDEQKAKIEINNLGCYFDNQTEKYNPGSIVAGFSLNFSNFDFSLALGKSFSQEEIKSIKNPNDSFFLDLALTPFIGSKIQIGLPISTKIANGYYDFSYGLSARTDIDVFLFDIAITQRKSFIGNFQTLANSLDTSIVWFYEINSSLGLNYQQTISGYLIPTEKTFSISISSNK